MALVGIMASIGLVNHLAQRPHLNLRKASRAMISELRRVRQKAISTGRSASLDFNPGEGRYTLTNIGEKVLPSYIRFGYSAEVKKTPSGNSLSGGSHDGVSFKDNLATFEPNGTFKGIGGTIYLTNRALSTDNHFYNETVAVSVNITGRVKLHKWNGVSWN